jgi:hypothetical protein
MMMIVMRLACSLLLLLFCMGFHSVAWVRGSNVSRVFLLLCFALLCLGGVHLAGFLSIGIFFASFLFDEVLIYLLLYACS